MSDSKYPFEMEHTVSKFTISQNAWDFIIIISFTTYINSWEFKYWSNWFEEDSSFFLLLFSFNQIVTLSISSLFPFYDSDYEWANRTKFLLSVIYGSPRWYSNSSNTFKKKSEKYKINFYDHFRASWTI